MNRIEKTKHRIEEEFLLVMMEKKRESLMPREFEETFPIVS